MGGQASWMLVAWLKRAGSGYQTRANRIAREKTMETMEEMASERGFMASHPSAMKLRKDGAPVSCGTFEGGPTRHFSQALRFMHRSPRFFSIQPQLLFRAEETAP